MAPSIYTPLRTDTPHLNIRLIRLQPSEDPSAPISCELVVYPLISGRPHIYECLSYVWGSPKNPKTIQVRTSQGIIDFKATPNLHAALLQLRDAAFERILWVDAICIDQGNNDEKATQVAAMARIYGLASRVVAWLGEEEDRSAVALRVLGRMAHEREPIVQRSSGVLDGVQKSQDVSRTCGVDGVDDVDATEALLALLNRNYFRRMWILQEITAARNLVIRCGRFEMQVATFVAGLDGFPQFDDRKLRNRIRAFVLLVHRSVSRESLKGEAHLNIDLLVDLIDRFHIHDATDPRDKIYALWGLSSDSVLIGALQPDYEKKWGDLMEELGRFVFGSDAVLCASSEKQMIYARSQCYSLGRVEKTSTENMSDMKQELKITSMKASTYLDDGYAWSRYIEINASAEEIQESDIVLYIPGARRLVIARPRDYYLRIISVIDSRQVQIFTPGRSTSEGYWASWQPFLDRIEISKTEVPLLWSWENDQESEDKEALRLVGRHYTKPSTQEIESTAYAHFEAKALSDMALLFMEWDAYQLACDRLCAMTSINNSLHGPETEITSKGHARLRYATKRQNAYLKARECLAEQILNKNEDLHNAKVVKRCTRVFLHAGMGITVTPAPNDSIITYVRFLLQSQVEVYYVGIEVWIDLASKIMSRGVTKELLFDAVQLCTLEWRLFCNSLYQPEIQSRLPFNVDEADDALRGVTLADNSDYLRYLLQMAGDDLLISPEELLAVSHANIDAWSFNQFIKHCEAPITNFASIIQTLVKLRHRVYGLGGKYLMDILEGNSDRITITPEAVSTAAQWDINAVSALLEIADDPRSLITASALDAAIIHHGQTTLEIIDLLAQYADKEWQVSEDALLALATSKDTLDRSRIFIALLEYDKIVVNVTERVLWTLLLEKNEIVLLLQFRPDLPIRAVLAQKELLAYEEGEWMNVKLTRLQSCAEDIPSEAFWDEVSVEEWTGYANLMNLLRYRRNEFHITEDMVLKAIGTDPEVPYTRYVKDADVRYELAMCQSHHDLHYEIDKYTSLLIRNADDDVISTLLGSPFLLDTAAERAYPRVIDSLRMRSKSAIPDLETYYFVAVFGEFIKNQNRYPPMDDNFTIGDDVLLRREVSPMAPKLLQILLFHVFNLQHDATRRILLTKVLARIVEPRITLDLQESFFNQVWRRHDSHLLLKILFDSKVIALDEVGSDTIPTDKIFELQLRRENVFVEAMKLYDEAASIDAKGLSPYFTKYVTSTTN